MFEMSADRSERFENHVLTLQFVGRFGEGLSPVHAAWSRAPMSRASLFRPPRSSRTLRRSIRMWFTRTRVYAKGVACRAEWRRAVDVHTGARTSLPDPWIGADARWCGRQAYRCRRCRLGNRGRLLKSRVTKLWNRIHSSPTV